MDLAGDEKQSLLHVALVVRDYDKATYYVRSLQKIYDSR